MRIARGSILCSLANHSQMWHQSTFSRVVALLISGLWYSQFVNKHMLGRKSLVTPPLPFISPRLSVKKNIILLQVLIGMFWFM